MFHDIAQAMQDRMHYLEVIDMQDRQDGTPRLERLRQIPPDTGKFLALIAAGAPPGRWIEIGTSAGYSTLWLALAARAVGAPITTTITTFEVLPEKVVLARETFRLAGIEDVVTLIEGDSRDVLADYNDVAFCFLDAEKEIYEACYDLIVPNLVRGGLLVADNAINHRDVLQPWMDRVSADPRVDALMIPMGKGEFICRKI